MRTRVGYTGGRTPHPTYRDLADHTEAIQVDYDPEVVSYAELLDVFWSAHDPAAQPWSTQYKSAIFTHDETQSGLATEAAARRATELGRTIHTEILPLERFHRAEDYHQKYRLRRHGELARELETLLGADGFVDATVSARLNGHLGGFESDAHGLRDALDLALSPAAKHELLQIVGAR